MFVGRGLRIQGGQEPLYVDNAASVAMINGGTGSWRTRHLKVRCAYIRDQVAANKLKVERIEGVRQLET